MNSTLSLFGGLLAFHAGILNVLDFSILPNSNKEVHTHRPHELFSSHAAL